MDDIQTNEVVNHSMETWVKREKSQYYFFKYYLLQLNAHSLLFCQITDTYNISNEECLTNVINNWHVRDLPLLRPVRAVFLSEPKSYTGGKSAFL